METSPETIITGEFDMNSFTDIHTQAGNAKTDLLQSEAVFGTENRRNLSDDWSWEPVTWSWWEIVQFIFSFLGIFGNLLIMIVLFQRRGMRKSTDILIGGLAAADFFTSIFLIPFPKPLIAPNTLWGTIVCKLVLKAPILMWISITASIFTLAAISIERYIAVVHPLRLHRFMTSRHTVALLILVWLCAIAANIPSFLSYNVIPNTRYCLFTFASTQVQASYGVFIFIVFYLAPALIMLSTYLLIAIKLHQESLRFREGIRSNRSNPAYKHLLAREKVIKLLFTVVLIFIFCWAPDNFTFLAYNVQWLDVSFLFSPLYRVLVSLAFFNSCVNPLIYSIQYPEFRQAIRDMCSRSSSTRESPLFGHDVEKASTNVTREKISK